MSYIPTIWKNRQVEKPNTFDEANNSDGTITLSPHPGIVIEAGTPTNADNMNHIEQGIATLESNVNSALAEKANQADLTATNNNVATNTSSIATNATNINTQKSRIDNLVQTASSSYYEKCLQTDTGALLVVSSGATTGQINLANVTPAATGYTPVAGDHVRLVYGVASGSAELIDTRIGVDGTAYSNSGNAVRAIGSGDGISNKAIKSISIDGFNQSIIYDGLGNTQLINCGGSPTTIYNMDTIHTKVDGTYLTSVELKLATDCTLKLYIFEAFGGVKYQLQNIVTINGKAGLHKYNCFSELPSQYTIAVSGDANTIYYSVVNGTVKYKILSTTANCNAIGNIVNMDFTNDGYLDLAMRIYVGTSIPIYENERQNKILPFIDETKANVSSYTNISDISTLFASKESAYANRSFLVEPIPFDGYITHVNTGINDRNNVDIMIFDWDRQLSNNNLSVSSTTNLILVNGASDCYIPVKKGQYIGGMNLAYTKTVATLPFIYAFAGDTPDFHNTESLILSYTLMGQLAKDIKVMQDAKMRWKGKTIVLFGDSISSNDYPWYKSFMEKKTGATVLNVGASGFATLQLSSDWYLNMIEGLNADLIICLVGGNDTGDAGTVGTFDASSPNGLAGEPVVLETDITKDMDVNGGYALTDTYQDRHDVQAISHIIRKLKAYYFNFRSRAGLTGSETEEEKENMLDAVKRTKIVFCTTMPQNRVDVNNEWSAPANWLRKRNAVMECCTKYKIPCIDIYSLRTLDMSIEPYWTNPTDKITNKGVYTMDGLHPNKYGYDNITDIIVDAIQGI